MERVAEQSGEEQVEEVRHWYGEVGANSRILSPFATRGKVGAAVTNRNGSWK